MELKIVIALITAISSFIVSVLSITFNFLKTEKEKKEEFKKEHYIRIINSYLKFWTLFRFLSINEESKHAIIQRSNKNEWVIVKSNFDRFIEELYTFFYSENGLFLSREVRKLIFGIRNDIREVITESEETIISNSVYKKIKSQRDKAIIQTRADIGLRDISIPVKKLELIDDYYD